MKKKIVYLSLTADNLHHGHIKLIQEAKKFGSLIVGLLTDLAVSKNKRIPLLNYDHREMIIKNISGVNKVIPQNEWDDSVNIKKLKPDYVIHGDDWLQGPQSNLRLKVIKVLKKYGGKLIEFPHTKGISSTALSRYEIEQGIQPESRLKNLKKTLSVKKIVRIIETHSPISGIIAEKASENINGKINYFDGFWSSSLTDASHKGKPDIEALNISERLENINNIFEVTSRPLIMDIDTGGKVEHLKLNIKSLERLGVSAIIMEDKTGLKKNSLHKNTSNQKQDSIKNFSNKIKSIKSVQLNKEFMVIARIESLILGRGLEDALKRAKNYVKAGADGIMIHSKKETPTEIFNFAKRFRKDFKDIPLVCVPSTYNNVKEKEFEKRGFNIVIYANHLFRAAYPAMVKTAKSILRNERSKEIDSSLATIKEMLELIPGTK
ncbi:phosphoenolpyruvate mutase [Candidatus Pelagibacter sp.]|nr:phosphoenolpyruvate mutase [Candidatus Pelagibacter sp.]